MFTNRVNLELTYYSKKTTNALFDQAIAAVGGRVGDERCASNLASVKNTGVEASITTTLLDRRLVGWDVTIGASHNDNKVLSLGVDGSGNRVFVNGTGANRDSLGFPVRGWYYRPYTFADSNGDGIIVAERGDGRSERSVRRHRRSRRTSSRSRTGSICSHRKLRVNASFDYKGGYSITTARTRSSAATTRRAAGCRIPTRRSTIRRRRSRSRRRIRRRRSAISRTASSGASASCRPRSTLPDQLLRPSACAVVDVEPRRAQPEGVDELQGRRSGRELQHGRRAERSSPARRRAATTRSVSTSTTNPHEDDAIMMNHRHRARWAGRWQSPRSALAALAACNVRDELLSPQQPGTILPGDISGAGVAGAEALRVGALGRFQQLTPGGGNGNQTEATLLGDLLGDVWKSGDTFIAAQRDRSARHPDEQLGALDGVQRSQALARLLPRRDRRRIRAVEPDKSAEIAEQYFVMGYSEMLLGELFCNGIPLSDTTDAGIVYTAAADEQQVFAIAITHLDSALALARTGNGRAEHAASHQERGGGREGSDARRPRASSPTAAARSPACRRRTRTTSRSRRRRTTTTSGASPAGLDARAVRRSATASTRRASLKNAMPFASAKDPRVPTTDRRRRTARSRSTASRRSSSQQIWTEPQRPDSGGDRHRRATDRGRGEAATRTTSRG